MTSNCIVTLWHFDGESNGWTRTVFPNAFADFKERISKSGIKQVGFYSADFCKIRIPTKEKIEVSSGDYVRLGKHVEAAPIRENALKVVEVSDNRYGGSPHYRISCGG
ncbi:MAG: hypothetical protein J6C82_03605 [Clostridia bacterium]|nr:hypothetical protein [Clostridia bacterium]